MTQINSAVRPTAPSAPPCFTRTVWVQFLASEQSGKTKPFNPDGSYRREFDYCSKCYLKHAIQMCVEGKCNPSFHRSNKEVRHVETV